MSVKRIVKTIVSATVLVGVGLGLAGCVTDSDRVSENLSTDAEYFRIDRDIVFYNGITDKYVAEVKGRCSVDDSADLKDVVAVTCKIGPNTYTKDYLHVSDNVTWFMIQSEPVPSDVYRRQIILKPENIIPNIQVRVGPQD